MTKMTLCELYSLIITRWWKMLGFEKQNVQVQSIVLWAFLKHYFPMATICIACITCCDISQTCIGKDVKMTYFLE